MLPATVDRHTLLVAGVAEVAVERELRCDELDWILELGVEESIRWDLNIAWVDTIRAAPGEECRHSRGSGFFFLNTNGLLVRALEEVDVNVLA